MHDIVLRLGKDMDADKGAGCFQKCNDFPRPLCGAGAGIAMQLGPRANRIADVEQEARLRSLYIGGGGDIRSIHNDRRDHS